MRQDGDKIVNEISVPRLVNKDNSYSQSSISMFCLMEDIPIS